MKEYEFTIILAGTTLDDMEKTDDWFDLEYVSLGSTTDGQPCLYCLVPADSRHDAITQTVDLVQPLVTQMGAQIVNFEW